MNTTVNNMSADQQPSELPRRALVVDDMPALGRLIKRILKRRGVPCDTVLNVAEAQEMLSKSEAYGVVFVDVNLPDGSGDQLASWIIEQRPALEGRVVVMTGDHRLRGHSEQPMLLKPILTASLIEMLNKVTGWSV